MVTSKVNRFTVQPQVITTAGEASKASPLHAFSLVEDDLDFVAFPYDHVQQDSYHPRVGQYMFQTLPFFISTKQPY